MTDTIQILPNLTVATQLVSAGDGATLIVNSDLVNTVYLGNSDTIKATDPSGVVPLGPNGSVVVDGKSDLFAVNPNSVQVVIFTLTGGLSQFLGLTQGNGSLVLPSIHSPNYSPGVSGWSINKSGSAEFNSLTIRGNAIFPNGWLSNGDGSLTSTPGFFLYSGTPAAGNLILAITQASGTDKFANTFEGGTFSINLVTNTAVSENGGVLTFYNTVTPNPGAPWTVGSQFFNFGASGGGLDASVDANGFAVQGPAATGTFTFDSSNNFQFTSTTDLNTYHIGKRAMVLGSPVTVNTTGFTTLISQNVTAPGRYRFHAMVFYTTTTTAAGNPFVGWAHGSTATTSFCTARAIMWSNTSAVINRTQFTHGAAFPADMAGETFVASGLWCYEIDGQFVVSSSGTVVLSAATSAVADPFIVSTGTFFEIEPYA